MSGERLADLAYAAGWRVVRVLPRALTGPLFKAGADYAVRRRGRGVTRLAGNLRRVVGPDMPQPEFDALVRAAMRSYMRYYLETFRLPSQSREQNIAGFQVARGHLLGEDVVAGRGAIMALPHTGNWDAAGAWVAANRWPIATVAERLKPESLYRRFVAFREGLGMEIIPLTGGERAVLEILQDRLRKGYLVPLLADRDLTGRGVEVVFFGAKTTMAPGPAILALRTGAPLYTVDIWSEKDHVEAYLRGPLELPGPEAGSFGIRVRMITQMIADDFARAIAAHPADWHMMQRFWPDAAAATGDETAAAPGPSVDARPGPG